MKTLLCTALLCAAAAKAQDARNTDTPGTNTHFSAPHFASLAEWETRRAQLRRQILWSAGLVPMPAKTPLNPQVFGRIEHADYTIEKVLLETLPGFYLGGNLYRPVGKSGKSPGILSPHGHWSYGRLENQQVGSIPARCINLARQGFVVFAYDMVGYNDTAQVPHSFGDSHEQQTWSFSPLGLQLWDSIRALDFMESLPDVDATRLGATGASGGASQIFLLAGVDDRVKFSAPVNMISLNMQGGSPCENAPGLRVGINNVEIAAIMAPRPMIMVSATGDWTHNTPKEEFPAMRAIYELYGKADNVETVQFNAEHNYNKDSREAVYNFFGKEILKNPAHLVDQEFEIESPGSLLALHNRTLPPNALTFDGLFAQWKAMSASQTDAKDSDSLRLGLQLALGTEWPEKVMSEKQGDGIFLSRPGRGDHVPAVWFPGQGAPVLVVDEAGMDAARKSAKVSELLRAHRPVLLIDAFQTGSAVAPRDRSPRFFLTFNRSDDANRVQDVLTALRFLETQKTSGQVEVMTNGQAGTWGLYAAAVAPIHVALTPGSAGPSSDFFVPGIDRAGGVRAATRLVHP
jgi:hypothetical protein